MHHDLDAISGQSLSTQVCIVGAGVAGIGMARRLLAQGVEVLLLESGGLDYDPRIAALNKGESVGLEYYPLDHARTRFFGGTTAIWGGRCAELDPIDFERRSWVPHSGWPIRHADLHGYYADARQALGLSAVAPGIDDLTASGVAFPDFDRDRLRPLLWTFDDMHGRFSFDNCRDLRDHPRCRIVTQATVREIVAAHDGGSVSTLDVRSLSGGRITVTAQHYVLAAGGIENPRLLLASRSLAPRGLGNDHDQVGRYFMEHPHARGGRVTGKHAWMLLNAFGRKHALGGEQVAALLTPGTRLQREQGLLNTSLTIAGRRPAGGRESYGMRAYGRLKHDMAPDKRGRTLWMATKKAVHQVLRYSEPTRPWIMNRLGILDVALLVRAEQAPNPQSRVQLSLDRDALGMQRAQLDWRTSAIDVDSVRGLVTAMEGEFDRLGIGRVERAEWLDDASRQWRFDPLISAHPIGGYHHMGTTRMSDSPRTGVTDGWGRVHGVGNLSIAGSSLFPTSGWANPTLTILALAYRTADAIVAGLSARQSGGELGPVQRRAMC